MNRFPILRWPLFWFLFGFLLGVLLWSPERSPSGQEPKPGPFPDGPIEIKPGADRGVPLATEGGTFFLNVEQLLPPAGSPLVGIANLGGLQPTYDAWSGLGVTGGLHRVLLYMHDDGDPARKIAPQIRQAQNAGLKVLVTILGTPKDLAGESIGSVDYGSIPLFARTVPIDKQAWAQQVVNQFYILQNEYGLMPEYAEIGNEPDRLEFWEGTLKDYFDLYSLASTSLRAHFPAMKVGGMGLAGYESQLEADQPALLEMIEYTQTNELPLDFLSWHNYGMGLQMRYTGALSEQHAKLEEYGLDESVELFVSEWNIMPNASQDGEDFDGSHAAANLATFLTAGVEGGLDGSAFFMLYDIDDQEGIADLTGKGLGALTARGIKKPVYRIMEFLYGMSVEERIPVSGRESDLALTVMATRLGDRVRVLIANDIVDTQWHFVKSCKEEGLIQGQVFRVLQSLGASLFNHPSREQLMSTGLNEKEATSVLDVLHLVSEEARRSISTRLLTLDLGEATPTVTNVWRFDDSHNAPATHRNDLLPFLESVELSAGNQAKDAALNRLIALGYTDITLEQLVWQGDLASTSLALGIPEAAVASAADAGFSVMRTARLDQLDYLNTLPGAALVSETAEEASIVTSESLIHLGIQPNGVMVLDLELSHAPSQSRR